MYIKIHNNKFILFWKVHIGEYVHKSFKVLLMTVENLMQ